MTVRVDRKNTTDGADLNALQTNSNPVGYGLAISAGRINAATYAPIVQPLPTTTLANCPATCVAYAVAPHGVAISLLPSLVSAVLVVAGWFVVNKAQANRERRKQIREYVADLRDKLEDLEKLVISYHTEKRDEAKEQEIISKLGRFEKSCSSMPRFLASQKLFKAAPIAALNVDPQGLQVLRKAMTLKHFADEHCEIVKMQDSLIQQIELAACNVHDSLDDLRILVLD